MINRKLVNSPAVTLEYNNKEKEDDVMSVDIVPTLEVPQGWPQAARAGPNIDNWLGKKCRRQFVSKAVYFVPKRPKGRNLKDDAKGMLEPYTFNHDKHFLLSLCNHLRHFSYIEPFGHYAFFKIP